MQALLYQAEGQLDNAFVVLEQAVTLAKPDGFIRTFVDLGTSMATLIYQLLEQGFEVAC